MTRLETATAAFWGKPHPSGESRMRAALDAVAQWDTEHRLQVDDVTVLFQTDECHKSVGTIRVSMVPEGVQFWCGGQMQWASYRAISQPDARTRQLAEAVRTALGVNGRGASAICRPRSAMVRRGR